MLRAVRFAARFGYTVEPKTFAAIQKHANEIQIVSAERIREELTKLLTEGAARRSFELLGELGLLPRVLPEIAALKGVRAPPQLHPEGDVWIHTLSLEGPSTRRVSAWLRGVLLRDIASLRVRSASETGGRSWAATSTSVRMADELCRRLRFSNDDTGRIKALVANHAKFQGVAQMRPSTLKRFVRLPRATSTNFIAWTANQPGKLDAYNTASPSSPDATRRGPPPRLPGDTSRDLGYRLRFRNPCHRRRPTRGGRPDPGPGPRICSETLSSPASWPIKRWKPVYFDSL